LHQVGDLFELNVKLRWQKVKEYYTSLKLPIARIAVGQEFILKTKKVTVKFPTD